MFWFCVGYVEILGHRVDQSEVRISLQVENTSTGNYEANSDSQVLVLLDCTVDESAESEGLAREVVNRIQKLRKEVSNRWWQVAGCKRLVVTGGCF